VSPFLKKSWILSSINTRLLPSLQLLRPHGTIRTVKTTSAKLGNQQRLQHIELCHILFVFGFFFFFLFGGGWREGGGVLEQIMKEEKKHFLVLLKGKLRIKTHI
jgi:hypothetical protein